MALVGENNVDNMYVVYKPNSITQTQPNLKIK